MQMNYKWTSWKHERQVSKTFQHFKTTTHCLLYEVYIWHHTKKYISEYIGKTCHKWLALFLKCRKPLKKISAWNFSKSFALTQVFSCHVLRILQSYKLQPISAIYFVTFNENYFDVTANDFGLLLPGDYS